LSLRNNLVYCKYFIATVYSIANTTLQLSGVTFLQAEWLHLKRAWSGTSGAWTDRRGRREQSDAHDESPRRGDTNADTGL